MCLAQGHNTVRPVRLDPAVTRSRVKHSTTEPLCSPSLKYCKFGNFREVIIFAKLGKMKSSRNGKINPSFTDIGKSC